MLFISATGRIAHIRLNRPEAVNAIDGGAQGRVNGTYAEGVPLSDFDAKPRACVADRECAVRLEVDWLQLQHQDRVSPVSSQTSEVFNAEHRSSMGRVAVQL